MKLILFDGDCNFCDTSVQFIIKHDTKELFHFSSLQSEFAQVLIKKYNIPNHLDSLILIDDTDVYYKSNAVLEICKHLTGAWKFLYVFMIIPVSIRNHIYNLIAKNRYKWFGKKEQCIVPTPDIRQRFLS